MLLIEESDTQGMAWDDSLIPAHLEQLGKLTEEAHRFCNNAWKVPSAELECTKAAAALCEESREIVFRIHRVTRQRVLDLMKAISAAGETLGRILTEMKNAGAEGEAFKKVSAYRQHIEKRVDLLDRLINAARK